MLKLSSNSFPQHQLGGKLVFKKRGMSATHLQAQNTAQAQEDEPSALGGSLLVSVTEPYL